MRSTNLLLRFDYKLKTMIGARYVCTRFLNRFLRTRQCTTKPTTTTTTNVKARKTSVRDFDAYRQLDKLNFTTAAKILFTIPPKKNKFGIDFHLVQFLFVLMPSLAVYLVAYYARYEMRRMDAELELKKNAEEEKKAKEMESSAAEEVEIVSDPELSNVKERLDKLEETMKDIVVESKKQSVTSLSKTQEQKSVGTVASQQNQKGNTNNEEPSQAANR